MAFRQGCAVQAHDTAPQCVLALVRLPQLHGYAPRHTRDHCTRSQRVQNDRAWQYVRGRPVACVCWGRESTTDVCCFDMFVCWGADMFRRARSKKAWSHSLRSSTDDSASRKAASRSRSDPKVSAVVGRLTDVKNFTGTHKHKHEELKSKRPHTSHGVGSRGTGAAAGGAGGGPVRPRTASAASEGDAGVDEAAGGGVAWEEAEPSAPQVSPRPASATRGSPPGSGSRKTPDRSPIRISQAGSRLSAGAATHDDNSARRDCLGTARLLDVVRPGCGETLPSE